MIRRFALILLVVLAGMSPTCLPAATKPNVVVILADDLGYSDLGCYGGEIATPNLDRLAANGLRFTQFYNTARCWPSRAALLTGYYAQQVNRDPAALRPKWAALLPELLKGAGYRSYHSGKWHVDGKVRDGGFDRSYLVVDQDRFFAPRDHQLDDTRLPQPTAADGYYATVAIADHARQWLGQHASEHRNEPFFLYLAFTSPHFPLQALPEDIERYRERYKAGWDALRAARWQRVQSLGLASGALSDPEPRIAPSWNLSEQELHARVGPGEVSRAMHWNELTPEQQSFQATKMAIHAAMVDRMDREIGRVIDQLRSMGVFDDTLILFASDNGASAEQIIRGEGHDRSAPLGSAGSFLGLGPGWSTVANTPFRRHKSWTHEGGIATPLIVHWPAGIAAKGALRHTPGHLIDIAPTLLELAAVAPPAAWNGEPRPVLPGRSLVPTFAGDVSIKRDALFFKHSDNRALRVGDWKIVASGPQAPWELYNLANDRAEMHTLAAHNPEKAAELAQLWLRRDTEYARQGATGRRPPARQTSD
ncbi:MAG: arylsulfatase [Isosphaeraceae bacterium]|nr:arylsulfatase [Isosphaeraceae bacterium]